MKKFAFILAVLLSACQETTINPTAVGTLRGSVISTLGEPVANARIETSPASSVVLTDSAGHFSIEGIQAGEYTVTAKLATFRNETVTVTVAENQTTQVVFSLEPRASSLGSLFGTLLDGISNQPIAGASITTNPPSVALITGPAGQFAIDSLAVGNYTVIVEKFGYTTDSVAVAVQESKVTPVAMLLNPADATAFNVPVQPQPSSAAREQPSDLTLRWSIERPRAEAQLRYDVLLYTADQPQARTLGQAQTDTQLEVSGLNPDQTYLWQVIVHDEQNRRTVGDVWTFRTKQ